MTCDRCPHLLRIRSALAPCQRCEAGKLHGTSSADATRCAERIFPTRTATTGNQPANVTKLDAPTEDALREFFASLFALDDMQLLLLRHVYNGGGYADFDEPLRNFRERLERREYDLNRNGESFRHTVRKWASSIVAALPQVASIFADTIDRKRGTRRQAKIWGSCRVG